MSRKVDCKFDLFLVSTYEPVEVPELKVIISSRNVTILQLRANTRCHCSFFSKI